MLSLHVTLSHYKRPDIQRAMLAQCRAKEVAVKYGALDGREDGDRFGKRPDILLYEKDVLSFAQKKATSFHISEETWSNPMQLATGMRKQELDLLRTGWDLVLDIDFPQWEATRHITHALIVQLREEGVPSEAITLKFSGNKGFHIAVPFEAFPETVTDADGNDLVTSDLFPDGVRSIVEYLIFRADGPENGFAVSEMLVGLLGREALRDMLSEACEACGKKAPAAFSERNLFICQRCEWQGESDEEFLECPKCTGMGVRSLLQPLPRQQRPACEKCGAKRFRTRVDLGIDTLLVSSRHMYRLVYSLHEKSGLASIPVPIDDVLAFDRERARPENVVPDASFLRRDVPENCAEQLLQRGIAFESPDSSGPKTYADVEWVGDAAPEELFPPTIKRMLGPMEDGRKRALFVLTNFLSSVGWTPDMIEARLTDWSEQLPEPLRDNILQGHLRYHRQKGQAVLPPNFDNDAYYKDLGVLEHDALSQRLKNPVHYVRLKLKQQGGTTQK